MSIVANCPVPDHPRGREKMGDWLYLYLGGLALPLYLYRIRQPFTGPAWKNAAGVTTPLSLKTTPSFITNCTFFNAFRSSSGLPGSAIMSAKKPALIGPRVFSVSAIL